MWQGPFFVLWEYPLWVLTQAYDVLAFLTSSGSCWPNLIVGINTYPTELYMIIPYPT